MSRIVLLGSGCSGSTLLSMGLALSPEVTALGEVSEFRRIKPEQHACTCGVVFGNCRLWGPLLREATEHDTPAAEFLAHALNRARDLESTPWCVDSVKNDEGLAAEKALGLQNARVVYLVRHPCGYVYSQLNSGLDFQYAIDAWVYEQQNTLAVLAQLAEPALTVQYEQLASKPGRTLAEVGAFVGIAGPFGERGTSWDWERAPWGDRQHILCGAGWRLSGRPRSVSEDVRWKFALHPVAQAKVVDTCRPLLRELGYAD